MPTGGCVINLDRDSVSKEFQSRIVLGKMSNVLLYISTGGQSGIGEISGSEYRNDRSNQFPNCDLKALSTLATIVAVFGNMVTIVSCTLH